MPAAPQRIADQAQSITGNCWNVGAKVRMPVGPSLAGHSIFNITRAGPAGRPFPHLGEYGRARGAFGVMGSAEHIPLRVCWGSGTCGSSSNRSSGCGCRCKEQQGPYPPQEGSAQRRDRRKDQPRIPASRVAVPDASRDPGNLALVPALCSSRRAIEPCSQIYINRVRKRVMVLANHRVFAGRNGPTCLTRDPGGRSHVGGLAGVL
jgi:hypothetical protein